MHKRINTYDDDDPYHLFFLNKIKWQKGYHNILVLLYI